MLEKVSGHATDVLNEEDIANVAEMLDPNTSVGLCLVKRWAARSSLRRFGTPMASS